MKRRLTLGLSANSQSFGAVVNDAETGEQLWNCSITYADGIAPGLGFVDSFIGDGEGGWYWSPAMTAMGLDAVLSRLIDEKGKDFIVQIVSLSGGFHQHARYDTHARDTEVLRSMHDTSVPLQEYVNRMMTAQVFPCWMHASAKDQIEPIAHALGGNDRVADRTGSAVTPRFPLCPIRKEALRSPGMFWADTSLHSGSSLIPSLLCGENVGLCKTEGSAWNLMDIRRGAWCPQMIGTVADKLRMKLPALREPLTCVGHVSRYFVDKYGFSPDCKVYPFTGDNIASLLGNGVMSPGTVVLSLGTSWTLLDITQDYAHDPSLLGNVMRAWTGGFMRMTCQTNGGKTMKHYRQKLGLGSTWSEFDRLLAAGSINPNILTIPFVFSESLGNRGVRTAEMSHDGTSASLTVPSVVHGLFAHLAIGSREFLGNLAGKTILATGGGSKSSAVLQAAANMLGATVIPSLCADTVALGSSMGAALALSRDETGNQHQWEDIVSRYKQHGEPVQPDPSIGAKRELFVRGFERLLSIGG